MKRKFFNRRGFTVAEMLICVAILAIFVSMAAVGTSAMFRTGDRMKEVAKAEILGSDVLQLVMNEIRYGEEFDLTETKVSFKSSAYGNNCEMTQEGGELVFKRTVIKTLEDNTSQKETETFHPIGTVAYTNVTIRSLTFKWKSEEKKEEIVVSVVICNREDKDLWDGSVTVCPLYLK